jgi:MFS family permease
LILLIIASNNIMLIFVGLLNGSIMLTGVTQGAITAELVPRELLGGWYGIIGLTRGLGNLIAPLLGGLIWDLFGPAYLFILLAIIHVLKLPILASIPSSLTRD